ncbi:MAG: metal ABC transporter substrate-binding protein [Desulfovibrio sp.]|nr:metal ABC transporter substrate-binding protein [Desulfovibrio sp.]
MKKILLSLLALGFLSAAANAAETLKVGASPTPHAEILAEAARVLEPQGIVLDIIEYSDYVQPNVALDNGDLDANYFQHGPYLDDFNKQKGTKLKSLGAVHYEPFGIYAGKTKDLTQIKKGAVVAVPNDATNEGRALHLLQQQGLITLKPDAGLAATTREIVENPFELQIEEIEAPQLVRSLPDVDLAVINGNYAILGGLKVADALAVEAANSLAAATYGNVLAVQEKDLQKPALIELYKALASPRIAEFMKNKYAGAVVPTEKK